MIAILSHSRFSNPALVRDCYESLKLRNDVIQFELESPLSAINQLRDALVVINLVETTGIELIVPTVALMRECDIKYSGCHAKTLIENEDLRYVVNLLIDSKVPVSNDYGHFNYHNYCRYFTVALLSYNDSFEVLSISELSRDQSHSTIESVDGIGKDLYDRLCLLSQQVFTLLKMRSYGCFTFEVANNYVSLIDSSNRFGYDAFTSRTRNMSLELALNKVIISSVVDK